MKKYGVELFFSVGGFQPYLSLKNYEYVSLSFMESDIRREGLLSRGKQPRLNDKVLNCILSDKKVKKL